MRASLLVRRIPSAALLAAICAFVPRAVLADEDGLATVAASDARRATLPPPDVNPFLGVILDEDAGAALVARVVPGSAAESAGVRAGDVLARLDAAPISGAQDLELAIRAGGVGASVRLGLVRAGRGLEVAATLGLRRRPDDCFRGARFGLAVVPLRFDDDAAPVAGAERLAALLFARTALTGPGASLADYYRSQSHGRLDVTGRVLDPVTLPGPRARYASQPMGGSPDSAFGAAARILEAREGSALREFDGFAFLHTGEAETRPGFALWPHRSSVTAAGRRVPYYVHGLAGSDAVGAHCHEFGHLLGLPDAYGTGHLTGSGDFCLMAIGHRGGGGSGPRSPFSLCAWCRVRLGWTLPAAVDPRTPQRIRLAPVSRGPGECLLVPLTPRTDEYLLLEVRRREGFDAELPSSGLLVWHVGGTTTPGQSRYGSYVDLVEAHGIDCVDASLVRTDEIAFPTGRARDLTPATLPRVRSSAKDAFGVWLTGIESAADGSVALTIGVLRDVEQEAPAPVAGAGDDGFVVRTDPVTGRSVRLYTGPVPGGVVPPLPLPSGGEQRR